MIRKLVDFLMSMIFLEKNEYFIYGYYCKGGYGTGCLKCKSSSFPYFDFFLHTGKSHGEPFVVLWSQRVSKKQYEEMDLAIEAQKLKKPIESQIKEEQQTEKNEVQNEI